MTSYLTTISQLEEHLKYQFGIVYGKKESTLKKVQFQRKFFKWEINLDIVVKSLEFSRIQNLRKGLPRKKTKKEFNNRRDEISAYLSWRHHVFAHLADTTFKQGSSPMVDQYAYYEYGSAPIQLTPNCLALGYEKDQNHSLNPEGKYQDMSKHFPRITILEDHQKVLEHYRNWQATFEKYENHLRIEDGESAI
ncbi:hypothetical protein [Spirulina sp. 06S082]|uniref:hypothetical protein n=1 Tax=Spirulina sp. 06S082 TaxID=3110248 RepID=UPI002B1FDBEC|nr:hypothetical protein [Spirulina sp. 06S082]MEA5467693.1 hypothetical protein [Spirulina sp. 06S082]